MKRSRTDSMPARDRSGCCPDRIPGCRSSVTSSGAIDRDEQVALRIARRAHADMAVGVDDAVLGENPVGRDEVFNQAHLFLSFGLIHDTQSALMPAAATTRDQRASSLRTSSPKRSGVPPTGSCPASPAARGFRLLEQRVQLGVQLRNDPPCSFPPERTRRTRYPPRGPEDPAP